MKLIFLGPPGAGKGTQATLVCRRYNIAHISTGDMLRAERKAKTPLGISAQSYIDKGELVPDSVIIDMVRLRLAHEDCKNGFLLDGFPRTVAQADALAGLTDIDHVINLEVPFERLVARISGRRVCPDCGAVHHISTHAGCGCRDCDGTLYQRADDKAETVENRLRVYEKQTEPLIAYYREKGMLHTIDGDRTPEEVDADLVSLLGRWQ